MKSFCIMFVLVMVVVVLLFLSFKIETNSDFMSSLDSKINLSGEGSSVKTMVNDFWKNPKTHTFENSDSGLKNAFISEKKNYFITYEGEDKFTISIHGENPLVIQDEAETDFLRILGVTKQEACTLSVQITFITNSKAYHNAYPLSFCPNNLRFEPESKDSLGKILVVIENSVVKVNDIYSTPGVKLYGDRGFVEFWKTDKYKLLYTAYDDGQIFVISIMSGNIRETRIESENKLLEILGISKEEACFLDIQTTFPDNTMDIHLTFCPKKSWE